MLSRKTIALNINNLSDARYFAAYDVDIMAYHVDSDGQNLGLIKEVIEWVEGPKGFLQLSEWTRDLAQFALAETGAQGLVVDARFESEARDLISEVVVLTPNVDYAEALGFNSVALITTENLSKVKEDTPFFILPQGLTIEQIETLISDHENHGFAFVGSDEEKVGYKSFEDQDEYIELLMD